jgi:hypothetical protein
MWTSRLWLTHLPARGYQETFAEIDSALKTQLAIEPLQQTTDPLF